MVLKFKEDMDIPQIKIVGFKAFIIIYMGFIMIFTFGYLAKLYEALALIFMIMAFLISIILSCLILNEYRKTAQFRPKKGTILALVLSSLGSVYFTRFKIEKDGTIYDEENKPLGVYDAKRNAFILTNANPPKVRNILFWSKDFRMPMVIYNERSQTFVTREGLAHEETIVTSISNTLKAKVDLVYRTIELAARALSREIAKNAKKGLISTKWFWIIIAIIIVLVLIVLLPMLGGMIQTAAKPSQPIVTPR